MATFNFQRKIVLITGGTRGLGLAMAKTFAQAGAHVICTGTALKGRLSQNLEYWSLDLTSEDSINGFIKKLKSLKRLDIVVNNAGINVIESIDDIKDINWDKIIQVNLTGAMMVMRESSKIMKKKRISGRILNISSIYGVISRAKRNAYSASKAGLIGLTRASALDLSSHGILVNALCPGFVLTDLTKSILSKSEIAALTAQVPLGRFGREEDIAKMALFLCSDLNTYMTGQTIIVDGGFSIQ